MSNQLFDAHNHLHDERLKPHLPAIVESIKSRVAAMVVNGSCEQDWPDVLKLARQHPFVIPSLGYHPWYVKEQSASWRNSLMQHLDQMPCAIGEIGLDRWIKDPDVALQEETFRWQLSLAAERNLPASIHCLQAWGKMLEVLKECPRPQCGFLLHSFGGPREMVDALADLGAYFSLPGYFAHDRKIRQRDTFKYVPRERLLIETDAPDQPLPESRVQFPLPPDASGKALNHPANLESVYQFASELLNVSIDSLAQQAEDNFRRLFGTVMCRAPVSESGRQH